MDPIVDRPRFDDESDGSDPFPDPELGLVDLVDHALVRLDGLRDRPRLSSTLTALLVFALVVGWGLTRWRAVEPIDDRIPRIDEVVAGGGPPPSDGSAAAATNSAATGNSTSAPVASDSEPTATTVADPHLVIHVSGAVRSKGLVEVPAGSRLADAITAAGGATATADVHRLNLATPLIDGMHVRVPEQGEEVMGAPPLIEHADIGSGTQSQPAQGGVVGAGAVNINQADATALERLPGIGPAIAGAIVTWREEHGPFSSTDDLLDVPGIGPAKLAAIEDLVAL